MHAECSGGEMKPETQMTDADLAFFEDGCRNNLKFAYAELEKAERYVQIAYERLILVRREQFRRIK